MARGMLKGYVDQMFAHITERGWGTWIRTKTNRVRVCCATVTPFPTEAADFTALFPEVVLSELGVFQICRFAGAHIAPSAFLV
jgi:hypothetical protein